MFASACSFSVLGSYLVSPSTMMPATKPESVATPLSVTHHHQQSQHSLIEKNQPIPRSSMIVTRVAIVMAAHVYWITYLLLMTSVLYSGYTSTHSQRSISQVLDHEQGGHSPAANVFNPLNAHMSPTPAKNADTAASASPPKPLSRPQPNSSVPSGSTRNSAPSPLRSLSRGRRRPLRFRSQRLTVWSLMRPPMVLPKRKPPPGAR